MWYLIAGTRGGKTRARILNALLDRPYNANQLTEVLSLDYKTIKHHLEVLRKNNLIEVEGEKYGMIYFPSSTMEASLEEFNKILKKMDA